MRTQVAGAGPRAVGYPTRGTTAPNRLRRFDRWLAYRAAAPLRATADPLVVDVGFGESPITTVELAARLRAIRPDVRVVGVEIDPARVLRAQNWQTQREPNESVTYLRGGFELPVPGSPIVVRACNVLRQYQVVEVRPAWETMLARLAPGGILVEGTCDEIGRLAGWVTLARSSSEADPGRSIESLTLSADLRHLNRPSDLAARLPKVLIHDNVVGRPVHAWLAELDRQWDRAAHLCGYGPRQRWVAAVAGAAVEWPVLGDARRWRLGEVTIAWHAIAGSGE